MTLDDKLKIAQLAFYSVGTVVAILTYIKAKNGLLNAVNTEYKKRVMDRLAEISVELLSEYDSFSPKCWYKTDSVKEVLDRFHKHIAPHKDEIIKSGKIFPGVPVSTKEAELKRQATVFKSDPFIPKKIKERLVDFFESRAQVMGGVFFAQINKYGEELAKGKHWGTLDNNHAWLHNKIMEDMRKQGCGISEIEKEVHDIRDSIQNYFESFDPLGE